MEHLKAASDVWRLLGWFSAARVIANADWEVSKIHDSSKMISITEEDYELKHGPPTGWQ